MRRVLVAFAFALLPAFAFLLPDGFFASSDGMIHLYRLFELDRSLRAGILFPRWFPLSGYGYGLPVLNYYPPLTYYLGAVFHLFGAGYLASIKLSIAFGFCVAALAMFLFARDLLGERAAFVAGVAYAYLPYLLSDAYVRGNFPEFLAAGLLPLALWAFRGVFHSEDEGGGQAFFHPSSIIPHPSILFAALTFALIVLTHHLTAMLFAALLAAYIGFLFLLRRDVRALARCVAGILLGVGLSAFYWLPALAELNLVYVGPASVARFIISRLASPGDFFAPSLAYTYLPQSDALTRAPGFPQTLLALLSIVVVLVAAFRSRVTTPLKELDLNRKDAKNAKSHNDFLCVLRAFVVKMVFFQESRILYPTSRITDHATRITQHASRLTFHVLFFFLTTALALAMTLTFSAPLWDALAPLRFLQFPWRFQVLASVGAAFLLGAWAKWIAEAVNRFRATVFVAPAFSVALILLGALNLPVRTFPLRDAEVDLLHSADSDYVVAQMGWGWTREFVPATVQAQEAIYAPIAKPDAPARPASVTPSVQIQRDDLLSTALRVSTAQPFELSLHAFFFPGWLAYIDGAPARTYPRGDLGLASVTVPPGDHAVLFRFEDTPLRAAANVVSLVALAGWLVGWLVVRRRASVGVIAALLIVAALLALRARAEASPQPVAVSANLGGQALLIGYASERQNDALDVTLYWLALDEMNRDYTSFVHLAVADGAVLAQHDGPTDQGLTPTTRWLPGEIIADRHVIELKGVAPGDYRLTAGMYQPLENGYAALGDSADLGQVRIQK